jgi:hypothetical protein
MGAVILTNSEKYLKDGVDEDEFVKELHYFWGANEYDVCEGIRKFLHTQAKKPKPTLTEDEKVILRNINADFIDTISRNSFGELILHYAGTDNEVELHYLKDGLFQFIKERRRIRNS